MNQQQLNKIDEEFEKITTSSYASPFNFDEQCKSELKNFLHSKLQEAYTHGARDSEAYKNMLDESQRTFEAIMEAREKGFADGINLPKISTPSCIYCGSNNLNTEYEIVGSESFKYLHCLNCGFNHEHVQI